MSGTLRAVRPGWCAFYQRAHCSHEHGLVRDAVCCLAYRAVQKNRLPENISACCVTPHKLDVSFVQEHDYRLYQIITVEQLPVLSV
ncbi:hypothetical protein PCO82_20550 [Pectobacteriaceae bacterium CE90]|nr:hypothetical protein PCO82_20550 [Pectobacteriaceae bacterium CE90]